MHARLYEPVQYEMEEKSIWRQKSGRNNARPLGTKSGRSYRPRRQCEEISNLKHIISIHFAQ